MHLAVALCRPTCGVFVATAPERYGYPEAPHAIVDARTGEWAAHLRTVDAWIAGLAATPSIA